jgi:predicted nucleotidyltransferase
MSRLGRQLQEILAGLERVGASCALIGGLALASCHGVRATQDVDLLADADLADRIDEEFVSLGYRCIHRSADAATYLRGDQRVDLLYASRPVARRLLGEAVATTTPFGALRVVSLEGLIAFKLQGFVNDPRRTQDLEDIRALIRANRASVDLDEVRNYFRLFDREDLLDELLATLS